MRNGVGHHGHAAQNEEYTRIAHAIDTAMAMSKISVCTVMGHLLYEAVHPLLYISFVVNRRDLFWQFLIIKLVLIVCFTILPQDASIRCKYEAQQYDNRQNDDDRRTCRQFCTVVLQMVPPIADTMPKHPASIHMVPSLFVH